MNLRKVNIFLWIVAPLWGVPSAAAPIDPKNPPHGRFSDEWLEIYIGEGKVGYAHSSMTRRDDLIDTRMAFHLKLGRVEQPVTINLEQSFTETIDGRPVSFANETDMSIMKTALRGRVENGRVKIVTSQYGMEQKQEFDFPKGALMAWGTFRESLIRGFAPGTEYTIETYAPELRLDGAVKAVTRVGELEDFQHSSIKKQGRRVTVDLETPIGTMQMLSWVNEDGVPAVSKMPVPGLGDMLLVISDQKSAMADFVPAEFFMNTVIKIDREIDYKTAKRITYRLTSKDPNVPIGDIPETDAQRVVAKTANLIDVVVERQEHGRKVEKSKSRKVETGKASDEVTKRRSDEGNVETSKRRNIETEQSRDRDVVDPANSGGAAATRDRGIEGSRDREGNDEATKQRGDDATTRRCDEDPAGHAGRSEASPARGGANGPEILRSAQNDEERQSTIQPDLGEYLSGNLMINIEDAKLVELAKQAAGGEKEPFALADKLRRFVTDYVESKTLNIGFATASEVARSKEGDCSEHGVLLAALARINGMPSRVVVGLAYVPVFGGQDDIFGYHLWTQVYIDGRWIDIDAALRETECSPIRIAFATSSLRSSGVADLSLPLISKLGAIDLKILKIE